MKMLRQSLAISLITLIIMPYPALADTSTPQTTTSATSTPAQESPTTKPEAAPSVAPPDGEGGVPPPSGPESASSENDPTYGPERSAVASTLRVEPDKFDGSLSYQFPIKSPPGRNGLDPKLSIVYSSKNADDTSAFGYGWSTNIPYIERINRRGANRMFNDNFYSSSFDGEVVASSTAANTEDYGPLVENGDFRVYQFKNRAYWRVTDKLGTIYTFGAASSSQLVNTASSTQVYRWYLNEVRDANGNYMTYTYTKDGAAIYPATITYTHSTSTAGIYEIAFSRENRSSHATSSVSGFPVVWKQRISEIQVKVNSSWVRKYTLGYTSGDNGGRNVLANIAETGRTEAGPSTNAYSTDLEADSSQYWSVADGSQSGLEPTAGLSISLWAKFESLPSNGQFMELVNKSASGSDRQYKLELYNNGGNYNLLMYYSDGTTGSQNSFQTGTISLSTGTWYQFGARVTASTQSIAVYKDGTSQSGTNNQNGNTSINGSGTAAFKIGGTADGYFDGKVDEVLFYSADIGNTAMSNLYSDPSNPSTTNLVSRWAFENSANDSQGSNLLTGSGSPTYSTDVPTFAGASTSVTLPTATFSYASSTAGFTRDTSWVMPVYFASTDCGGPQGDTGARFDDFNGDGWTDIMRGHNTTLNLYLNNRNGSWSTSTPSGMAAFVNGSCIDQNVRAGDVDGDSLADIIAGDSNGDYVRTNTARGSSFVDNGWGDVKINFSNVGGSSFDAGGRLVDVNGDGLLDLVAAYDVGAPDQAAQNGIYLNNGAGWDATTTYAWSLPSGVYFAGTVTGAGTDYGAQFADFNGDGLIDIMQGRETGSTPYVTLYLNDGDGTWTTVIPSFQYPFVDGGGADNKIRIADINVDGLPDLVRTDQGSPVYINQDGGKTFATSTIWSTLPVDFVYSEGDGGARFVDINGDGLVDIVKSNGNFSPGTGANGAYMHGGEKPDLLKRVVTSQGGSMSITYKATPKFTDGASNANPVLPFVLPAVSEIGQNDGFGTIGTTTYAYGGGEYFYGDEFNRKFAGFATTTITDSAGNVTKIFAHQGNGTQSALGEYSDDDSKIGKPYRVDISDGSNNVYKRTLTRWENSSIPNSRDWVKKTRDIILAYDGDGDHKDTAVIYTYDPVNGNMLTKSEYGEVSGSDDGSFSDTGSDKRTATYTYAASSTLYTLDLPQREIITNSASTTIADKKFYYDGLSLGSATKGNLTKEERWISGSSWIDTEKTYDGLGLVVQEKDPRDKATTYVYDSYKLFVATTTDPLSHVTDLYYDLSSGKPTKRVDPNQRSWEWTYDGLDRPISEKIPDHLGTPSNTVLKAEYAYTDTAGSRKVLQTNYLNAATTTLKYTYLDGLNRPIQERIEAEDSNYAVRDFDYDTRGDLEKESVPYFSSGTSLSSATTSSYMLTTYAYDPPHRPTSIVNTKGTETHAYDQWKETITDRSGKIKDLTTDAFGNLSQVDEHYATTTYSTAYTYDPLNNLTRITDAFSNLRNFAYDGLSRLTSSEDLHASGDGTFGTRTFVYDISGNLATSTDAKSQVVEFTYDDINRVLTEDYSGEAGTEITYAYDSCTNGIGRMCSATTTAAATQLTYDALGNVSTERRTIDSTTYLTTYARDRLGNTTSITHPNNAVTSYTYNTAGLLEDIGFKHVGASTSTPIVTDLDYAPTQIVSVKQFQNNAETTYDFDASDLYRLHNLTTYATSTSAGGNGNSHSTDLESSSSQYWYITDGNQSGLEPSAALSISMWVKFESLPASGQFMELVNKMGSGSDRQYKLELYNNGGNYNLLMYYSDGTTGSQNSFQTNAVSLTTNTWYHFGVRVTASSQSIVVYKDGASQSGTNNQNGNTSINGSGTAAFKIGGTADGYLDGKVDEVLVYSADIGNTDMATLYSNPTNPRTTNLISRFAFDNDGFDAQGGNDLTQSGSPTFSTDTAFTGSSPSTATPIQSLHYTYDTVGNITQMTDYSTSTGKIVSYAYDDLHRLTFASSTAASSTPFRESYSYSGIGNITGIATSSNATSSYSYIDGGYNNPHAASIIGNATQTYDRNGNVLSTGTWNYLWDYRDRLTQATTSSATTTFGYDYSGQRVISQTASSTTVFPSKYFSVTSQTIASTTYATSTSYIFANDQLVAYVDQPLINGTATGTAATYYVHPDHLGSTNVITSASGTVQSVRDFFPFGSTRVQSGAQSLGRGYIGEFQDSDTLSYLQNRYYQSDRGQFMSEDPTFLAIGDPGKLQQLSQDQQKLLSDPQALNSARTMGGLNSGFASGWSQNTQSRGSSISQLEYLADPQMQNSYAYARGNPLRYKDPDGNFPALIPLIGYILTAYGAAQTGVSGYDYYVTNVQYPQVFSAQERNQSKFNFEFNVFLNAVGFGAAKVGMGAYGHALDALTATGDAMDHYFGRQIYQNVNYNQLQSQPTAQSRQQFVQTYNATFGLSTGGGGSAPSSNSLWTTPSGAVVTFGGQLVAGPPSK